MAEIPEYKPKADKAPGGRPTATAKKGKRTPPKPTVPVDQIREDLTEFLVGIGILVMARNENDGYILIGGTPDIVDAWCDLAEKNLYVHYVLQKLTEAGDLGKVFSSTVPLVLAIAANHGTYNGPVPLGIEAYKAKAEGVIVEVMSQEESSVNGSSGTDSSGASIS